MKAALDLSASYKPLCQAEGCPYMNGPVVYVCDEGATTCGSSEAKEDAGGPHSSEGV